MPRDWLIVCDALHGRFFSELASTIKVNADNSAGSVDARSSRVRHKVERLSNTMWLFYVMFVAACSGSLVVSAQDGFVFDGPTSRPTPSVPTRTSTERTTSTTTASSVSDAEFDACVAACPSTPEYNPVCGSDNGDYENPGRLSCASACGRSELTVKYFGRCMTEKIRG